MIVDWNISDPFEVSTGTGILQGDVLAPFLFIILVAGVDSEGVTHPRRSRRYPAKILNDLDFADDIAMLESSISQSLDLLQPD